MGNVKLRPPLLLIGAPRSGKTTLARILGAAPGMCHWSEPDALLRTGHAFRASGMATAVDARPWVKRHMRRMCLRRQRANGDARLLIESPLATFKIPFLHAVFPEAQFIHLLRDGREAVALRQASLSDAHWRYNVASGGTWRRAMEQLRLTAWRDLPAFALRVGGGLFSRYLAGKRQWTDVKYPGWQEDFKRLNRPQITAKRWCVSVSSVMRDLATLPEDSRLEVRLENLIADPGGELRKVAYFSNMQVDDAYLDWGASQLRDVAQRSGDQRFDVPQEALAVLQDTLTRLNYR